jgi:hypothetical protein
MRNVAFACLTAVGLLLSGCAGKQAMSTSEFRGLCLAGGGEKLRGCSSMDICYPLADRLENEPGALGHCLDICQGATNSPAATSGMNSCAPIVNMARNMCIKYCRINYEP